MACPLFQPARYIHRKCPSCRFSIAFSRPTNLAALSPQHRHISQTPRLPLEETLKSHNTHYHFFPKSLPSGPPPHGAFSIDLSQLRKEFLQLQAGAHPDRHPPESRPKAQALSARINEAYKTLQSPLLRAQYLLSLRGVDCHLDERAKVEDPELLMEVLEAREQIEEADSEEEIWDMRNENDKRIEESVGALEDAFASDDIQAAQNEAVRLRYWVNIKESLDNWEQGGPVVLAH